MEQPFDKIKNTYLTALSEIFETTPDEVLGKSREKNIVKARHITQYLLVVYVRLPYTVVGKMFNRHHASVIHAVDNILTFLKNEEEDITNAFIEIKAKGLLDPKSIGLLYNPK